MSHRLFFALLPLPLYGPTLANGKDIVASPSSEKVIAFVDGRWMRVQRYIAVGPVVLMTTTDGKLRSVRRSSVNLEATERKWGIALAENRPRSMTDRPNGSLSTGDRFALRSTSLGTHTDHKSKEAEKSEAAVRIFEQRKKYAYAILRNCSPS